MKNDFVKEQEEVRALLNMSKYVEAIEKCNDVLNTIYKNKIEDEHNKWFFNLRIAIAYRKLNQCNKAINYVLKGKNYTTNLKEHMECNWVLGNCYYSLKQYKKAVLFFRQCSDFFRNNNMKDDLIHMDFNIAKIENDDKKIKALIEEAYNMIEIDANSLNNAEWFLNNAYETLCEIYIDRNETNKIEENIARINDDNIVFKLRSKIQAINNC